MSKADFARGVTRKDPMALGLAALNRLAGARTLDRFGVRKPVESLVSGAVKNGFQAAALAGKSFTEVRNLAQPARPRTGGERKLFDLTADDEQQMIVATMGEFAAEQLRPIASVADHDSHTPQTLLAKSAELGITAFGVPEELGGYSSQRSVVTNVLVAQALAHGDMGLALSILAPAAVSNALVLWGDATQQGSYLPAFASEKPPAAALAIAEPHPLFDPFSLRTKAFRRGDGFVLSGEKSMVARASSSELFVIAADIDGRGPALFLVEPGAQGLSVRDDPGMGLRAAETARVVLDQVVLPAGALLAEGNQQAYADCVRLSRLGWAALAVGTSQAVLDYVVPYVKERTAFGEPISNRQGVAFKVADIGIELDALRLVTHRAASRAEQGLPFARETALARKLCSDKAMAIGSDGVQLLGGHGFVKEHPVERWYRDLRAVSVMEGGVLV